MEGVEILATEEVAIAWELNWVAFWIAFAITAIFAFIYSGACLIKFDVGFAAFMFVSLCVVAVLLGCLFGGAFEKPVEYETHYKVTISDEVPMNEFLERYEIIDQEGKIFTVRETHGISK